MTISINTVAFAETLKYRVEDFQIGILYMNNDGTYDSHEAFEAALKRYSLGGLPFGETIKRFEGGTHYYYSDLNYYYIDLFSVSLKNSTLPTKAKRHLAECRCRFLSYWVSLSLCSSIVVA